MNPFGIGKLKPVSLPNQFKDVFPGGGSDAQTYFTANAKREAMARVANTKLAKLGMEGRRNTTERSQRYDRPASRSAYANGEFTGSPMLYSADAGGLRGGVIVTKEGRQWLATRLAQRAKEFEAIDRGNFSAGPPARISLQPSTDALDTVLQQVVTTFDTGTFTSGFMEIITRLQAAFIDVGATLTGLQLGRYARIIQRLYETIRSYRGDRQSGLFGELGGQEEKVRVVSFTRKTLQTISEIINEISRTINEPPSSRELVMSQIRSRILGTSETRFLPSFIPPSVERNIAAVPEINPSETNLPRAPAEPPTNRTAREEEMDRINRMFEPEPYVPAEEQNRIDQAAGLGRRRRYRR